jgi:hypothetical protein
MMTYTAVDFKNIDSVVLHSPCIWCGCDIRDTFLHILIISHDDARFIRQEWIEYKIEYYLGI